MNYILVYVLSTGICGYMRYMRLDCSPFLITGSQAIYNDQGQLLLGCSASFKKITQVKANLAIIAQNPGAKRFVLNPQGVAEPA